MTAHIPHRSSQLLPQVMPGALRLRLAHGYATRTSIDAARMDATVKDLHYYRIGHRITELRGLTNTGQLLRVSLVPNHAPTHVLFRLGAGPYPAALHIPLSGSAAHKVRAT